jgi:hypothetical protein
MSAVEPPTSGSDFSAVESVRDGNPMRAGRKPGPAPTRLMRPRRRAEIAALGLAAKTAPGCGAVFLVHLRGP